MIKEPSQRVQRINVQIEKSVHERVKKRAISEGRELRAWTTEVLYLALEKDEVMKCLAPDFRLAGKTETSLLIEDVKQKRSAEVTIEDDKLLCRLCGQYSCPHIDYARMLPELGYLNHIRRHGGKRIISSEAFT